MLLTNSDVFNPKDPSILYQTTVFLQGILQFSGGGPIFTILNNPYSKYNLNK